MENFFLPPLPDDFIPDFLVQPEAISNDDQLNLRTAEPPSLNRDDSSRVDHFPKDEDGSTTFFDELDSTADNIAQERPPFVELTRDQWIEAAAFLSQSLVKGLRKKAENLGASSLYNDLPLESRENLTHFANDVEKIHRFFKLPYHERNSLEFCSNCLTAQGSTPTLENWKAQLELCGHDATVAKQSLLNQFIMKFNTSMQEWYEENRKMAHDEVVNRIVNPSNPPLIGADPRIIEWSHRYADQVREGMVKHLDTKAKDQAQDNFTNQLVAYELHHSNDLAIKKQELETQYIAEVARVRQDTDDRIKAIRQQCADQIRHAQETLKDNTPTLQDPIARKKRRGSISIVASPTIMKRQDTAIALPTPPALVPPPPAINHADTDPMSRMAEMFSKHFESLTKRLDKIEANNNAVNSYVTNWEQDRDPARPWGLPDQARPISPIDTSKYDNLDYDDPRLYDNANDFMGEEMDGDETMPTVAPTLNAAVDPDSDCVLLSEPPSPAAPIRPPAPPGLRPPERAKRVDFINPNLATDSFGMTGGRCLPDGSVSFAPPPKAQRPPPRATQAFSEDTLQSMPKEDIRNHAKFLFNADISKRLRKEDTISQYLVIARNANKPGAPQQTKLSFAAAAGRPANARPNNKNPAPPRQSTPSAWSTSSAGSPPPRRPPTKPRSNTTTWIIRPRMGSNGLTERPFQGSADKLTDWYRQRLQANAGDSKPALTLLSGKWANGPKSIFSLIFAGNIPPNNLRRYSPLFLEKFDRDHFFHPADDMKKIALFNIPMKRDSAGNVPTRLDLYKEIMRGGTLAGLDYFDGPCWTPNSRNNPDATTGVAHILVRAPTNNALINFFKRSTYMFNARIAAQTAIPPHPFIQCSRCHQINHSVEKCRLPNTASVCSHCGSHNHRTAQHKLQCKEVHDGPSCSCPPRCFLCRNARKSESQFTGHTALDSTCPLRRYTFVPSGPTNEDPTPTNV